MKALVTTRDFGRAGFGLDDFVADLPKSPAERSTPQTTPDLIDGITLTSLVPNTYESGSLTELLTTRDGPIEPIVHVYQVSAAPGSIRAWVYHRHQFDRLAFTNGRFEIACYDLRPESRTAYRLNVFVLGSHEPFPLRIPPNVVHGVRNASTEWATFINMPTKAYDRNVPDKSRLPYVDARIPYVFKA